MAASPISVVEIYEDDDNLAAKVSLTATGIMPIKKVKIKVCILDMIIDIKLFVNLKLFKSNGARGQGH